MRAILILSISIVLFQRAVIAEDLENSVASIKYRVLRELLLERAFAKEENAEIKKSYNEFLEKQKTEMKELREKMERGDFNPMEYAKTMIPGIMQDYDEYHNYAKEELILIIDKLFPGRFKLILDATYYNQILYSTLIIPDITSNVKQYLLKNRPSLKSN